MNYANINSEYVWAMDIETARNSTAKKFHEKFGAKKIKEPTYGDVKSITPPKTWKDQEKIDKYMVDTKAKIEAGNVELKLAYEQKIINANDELGKKDALTWMTGKIVSIAAVNVNDVGTGVKKTRTIAYAGMDEKKVLEAFCKDIIDNANGVFQMVGKSSSTFDFPFLIGRLMVHDIPLPSQLKDSYSLLDIDKMICSYGQTGQTSTLAKYSFALGFNEKLMDGSEVPALYENAVGARAMKNMDEYKKIINAIKEYNIDDCIKTAAVAYKLLK